MFVFRVREILTAKGTGIYQILVLQRFFRLQTFGHALVLACESRPGIASYVQPRLSEITRRSMRIQSESGKRLVACSRIFLRFRERRPSFSPVKIIQSSRTVAAAALCRLYHLIKITRAACSAEI